MPVKKETDDASRGHLLYKYLLAAIVLGIIEGIVTYIFLHHVLAVSLSGPTFQDPLSLAPYLLAMVVIAIIVLGLSIQGYGINAVQFLVFLALWAIITVALYLLQVRFLPA